MQEGNSYKNLGMGQFQRIDHRLMKVEVYTEFTKQLQGQTHHRKGSFYLCAFSTC